MDLDDKAAQAILQYGKLLRSAKSSKEKSAGVKIEITSEVDDVVASEKFHSERKARIIKANINSNIIEYSNVNKALALRSFAEGNELEGICNLVESHAALLRQQIIQRSSKTKYREQYMPGQVYGLNSHHVNFNLDKQVWSGEMLLSRLKELPKEWHLVQITSKYKPYSYKHSAEWNPPMSLHIRPIHDVHVTVLPTGQSPMGPICVTLPAPSTVVYDAFKEIGQVLHNLRTDLKAPYASTKLYWKMREAQNSKMMTALSTIETSWLREWRVLLLADFIEEPNLIKDIRETLDKFIDEDPISQNMSRRDRWLLKKIALGSNFLNSLEIARAIKYILPDNYELARKILHSILSRSLEMDSLKHKKRKTLVFIIDESMDHIPFESLKILRNQPVSRMPSFHVAYALFKEYEDCIEDGCKIVKVRKNSGSFIVNPSTDLSGTEKRMKVFNDYWLPDWTGTYGESPGEKDFESILVNKDLLMYNGHGSGIQYLPGDSIEKLAVKTVVMLFGCSSTELVPCGRYPPFGISNHYLTAKSPSLLGMLWLVTDTDIDRLTVNFLSKWLKSTASRPWYDVDNSAWTSGKLSLKKNVTPMENTESEMLRAIALSRWSCMQFTTSASVVVRGLPVKLVYE